MSDTQIKGLQLSDATRTDSQPKSSNNEGGIRCLEQLNHTKTAGNPDRDVVVTCYRGCCIIYQVTLGIAS